ncbi:Fe-S metabolism protein SufE [Opitutaceae bacterium EW11]|nr:Fe-S metabolism protein SufE [Opitutaceae bacterium EW11]
MTVAEKEQQLAEELLAIPDRQERMGVLVDRARRAPKLDATERTPANRVEGCSSAVWLAAEVRDGLFRIRGDAEAPMVKAFVHLLCLLYDGNRPADIAATNTTLFEKIELLNELSPTRRNGLLAIRARIRRTAAKLAEGQP